MKCERLKKRADFVRLQKKAKSRVLPAFVLLYLPNQSENTPEGVLLRVGFTASKRVGNSVCRNRARRRLRAVVDKVVRLNPNCQCPKGFDLVLIAKHSSQTRDFERMCTELSKALEEVACCTF